MAVDSGSEVHTAPVAFPWNVEQFDKTSICLSDVQGNRLKVYVTALLNYGVHDVRGNVIENGTRFLVSDAVKFVLSVGELGRRGWSTTLGPVPCLSHEVGCQLPLTRKANSARFGFYGEVTTSAGSATPSPSGRELGTAGASGALLPPLAEALLVPMDVVPEDVPLGPVLPAWSPVAALRDRLKALNGPVYDTKDELWKRLCEYEARAEQQLRERQWIEARKNELIQGARPHEADILDAPSKPEDPMEIERHEATHIPPMPRCLACRLGKGRDASHFRSPAVQRSSSDRRSTSVSSVKMQLPMTWRVILCRRTPGRRYCVQWMWRHRTPLATALPGKNAELEYAIWQLISFIKRFGYTELVIRSDGEPAVTAIVDRLMAEIKKTGVQARVRPEKTPRYSSQSLGDSGQHCSRYCRNKCEHLKTDLETKVKSHLLTSRAVWPWLVRNSAWLVERYQMRANGRTSYHDSFGTVHTGIVQRFGEQAIFGHPVGTAAGRNRQTFKQLRKEKAANKMDLGIWHGKTYETDEHYM